MTLSTICSELRYLGELNQSSVDYDVQVMIEGAWAMFAHAVNQRNMTF